MKIKDRKFGLRLQRTIKTAEFEGIRAEAFEEITTDGNTTSKEANSLLRKEVMEALDISSNELLEEVNPRLARRKSKKRRRNGNND